MSSKESKNQRILDLYTRLLDGKVITDLDAEAAKFGVDKRSIQRDISDIKAYLKENAVELRGRSLVDSKEAGGKVIIGGNSSAMSNDEILAVSKILLDSRAFPKEEMEDILDKLLEGCAPKNSKELVSSLIRNEKFHYVELDHRQSVKGILWGLGEEIRSSNLLNITYYKQVSSKDMVERVVLPLAIIFSEYYFYLCAFLMKKDGKGKYKQEFDYPTVFRVDRINDYKETGEKGKIDYGSRFEEGEFRKRVQFMFPGKLVTLQFKYSGPNVEAVLDRLPTATIKSKKDGTYTIEADVYGKGILMWLLSQGSAVEVIRPRSIRDEMKQTLEEMLKKYS